MDLIISLKLSTFWVFGNEVQMEYTHVKWGGMKTKLNDIS